MLKKEVEGLPKIITETRHDYCDWLFLLEETIKDLSPEERKKKRLELETSVLEAFCC